MPKIAGGRERSRVSGVTFVVGAEAAEVINVAAQALGEAAGAQGVNLAERVALDAYWSDDAGGDSLAAAHSAGTAIGTAGTLIETIAERAFKLITDATGAINIDANHVGAKTAYLVLVLPDGALAVSPAVTHA